MIRYTITSGTPTPEELIALEVALKTHRDSRPKKKVLKSTWGEPQLRQPLPRKV
ncbi:MAG TPA: hypothetical protein VMW30_00350 [Candidatus Paceibacterota bacterium]|nr:hypothetical protein [Candidatus Paceibacterota bacterium]